jgi:farnesyl diphosphate synthase
MRHALLGGGKRLRPFLVMASARLFGVEEKDSLPAATALECLHCYSLVHDDLPAMDDDELRRGRPTVHVVYGEATAILAGDALLTLAFEILADPRTHADANIRAALALDLARAAGSHGMAGGQMLDLAAEAGNPGEREIGHMQELKTGRLIEHACAAGAILGHAGDAGVERLRRYGRALGAAFQIADDLLDREASTAEMGKATGKDKNAGKATLVDFLGIDGARARLAALTGEACAAVAPFGTGAETLTAAARFVMTRRR